MTLAFVFWFFMLLLLLGAGWSLVRAKGQAIVWEFGGLSLIAWVLLALLGWQVFGDPIK